MINLYSKAKKFKNDLNTKQLTKSQFCYRLGYLQARKDVAIQKQELEKANKLRKENYKNSTTIQMFNNVMNNSKKTVYNSSSNTGYKNSKTIQMFNKVYKPH